MHSDKISLIVTSRDRVDDLQRLFESLLVQTNSNFTILLGDQNAPGVLDPLLAQYSSRLKIEHVMLEPQSLSQARNALLPLAKGDYVALTDDDCYYAPNCLAHVLDIFATRDLDGLIANPNGILSHQDSEESRYSIFKDAPSWVLFFTRQAIQTVGMFDESLGIGSDGPYQSGEETDYLARLIAIGGKVRRTNLPVVYHNDMDCSDAGCVERAYGYALGRMELLRKHNFPLWFKVANILYPLAKLVVEPARHRAYRLSILKGRLHGFLKLAN